jgi:hypothetical protein
VDVPLLIKHRLKTLRRGQKDLAAAAQVTESYISRLLKGKKMPPASGRTDIYDRIERFLKLPAGTLATMADLQRTEALKKKLANPAGPLFKDVRGLILRRCEPRTEKAVRAIFEKEPFGALERLVTQKLLDVAQRVARQELRDENWLRLVARHSGRSYRQIRVVILDFLETDVFNLSVENCVTFLEPLIESWDIDLATFGMEIVLNQRLPGAPEDVRIRGTRAGATGRARTPRVSRGSLPQRRRDGGGSRVPREAAVHAHATDRAVLLPGAAKPAGPASFSRVARMIRPVARCTQLHSGLREIRPSLEAQL